MALVSPADKIDIFSVGEKRAEKSVWSPQVTHSRNYKGNGYKLSAQRFLGSLREDRRYKLPLVHKKDPRNHLYPFFLEFLKKVIGSAKNELFWSEIGESFQKACRTDTIPPFSRSHHSGRSQQSLRKLYHQTSFVSDILLIDTFCA